MPCAHGGQCVEFYLILRPKNTKFQSALTFARPSQLNRPACERLWWVSAPSTTAPAYFLARTRCVSMGKTRAPPLRSCFCCGDDKRVHRHNYSAAFRAEGLELLLRLL